MALLAVLREGIEAALFLIAAATEDSGWSVLIGGLIGLALASVVAWVVYCGGRSLPMKAFFTVTGVILIVFAAGLASRTVLFLQGAGDLGSMSLNGVYDLRQYEWLTQSTEVGKFLAAMFGWDPRPSIEQVVVYLAYLVPVLTLFLRPQPGPAGPASSPGPRPPPDAVGPGRSLTYGSSDSQSPASSLSLRPAQVEPNSSSTEPTGVSVYRSSHAPLSPSAHSSRRSAKSGSG